MAPSGWGLFSLYIYIENFKKFLVRSHWTDFNITWQEYFLGDLLPRLFKLSCFIKNMTARGRGLFSLYIYLENFNNLLVRNHWTDFNITRQECFLGDLLPRLFKLSCFIKNMTARGRGLFSLYIYLENFNNLLVRNHWIDFNITWQECFLGDLLPRLFKLSCFIKNMTARGRGLFSLYIYIKDFKTLLLRNRWTEFNVIWQECCFGDLLPRLFKPFMIRQKTWPQGGGGAGLILHIYLYRKL